MSSRYYETADNGEDIKPGKISSELRAALNIADNDLPIWIYRMRALGYPPGWLNKAKVDTSDIFVSDSQEVNTGRKRECPTDEIQYDFSKLIEYPGFNSPLPPNTTDYCYYYNMPPMLPHQQLDYAKTHMNAFRPAPIPKRNRTSAASTSTRGNTSSSKNGDDEEDDDEEEEEDDDEDDDSDKDCTGPASPETEENGNTSNGGEDNKSINKSMNQSGTKSNLSSSLAEEIKLVSKGSPMPKPVTRLPLEKFSEGVVGELLYFENTPNSSGKFDSIRGLLDTIRKSKEEEEEEDDDDDDRDDNTNAEKN